MLKPAKPIDPNAHNRSSAPRGDTDARPERLHDAFPGPTLERLRALKAVYDADNVFNQNSPIPSETAARAAA